MEFEWDEDKNRTNKLKHGVSFETARQAFQDPFALLEQDRHVDGEERWQATGLIGPYHLVVVAYTYRDKFDGTETIRIISARPALRHEVRGYERAKMG